MQHQQRDKSRTCVGHARDSLHTICRGTTAD